MHTSPNLNTLRNLLIAVGAYYLSWFVISPMLFVYARLTDGIVYKGSFAGNVVLPLVLRVPVALVAMAVGASIIWLVESKRPIIWTICAALLYAIYGFRGHHWARPPLPLERVGEAAGALLPGLTCILGGIAAGRWRAVPSSDNTSPVVQQSQ